MKLNLILKAFIVLGGLIIGSPSALALPNDNTEATKNNTWVYFSVDEFDGERRPAYTVNQLGNEMYFQFQEQNPNASQRVVLRYDADKMTPSDRDIVTHCLKQFNDYREKKVYQFIMMVSKDAATGKVTSVNCSSR